jgi:hypothetical protein
MTLGRVITPRRSEVPGVSRLVSVDTVQRELDCRIQELILLLCLVHRHSRRQDDSKIVGEDDLLLLFPGV